MLVSRKHLTVVVNPFAAPLDHEGRPCTIAQYDPEHAARYTLIGCERRERIIEKRKGDRRGDRTDVTWAYDLTPANIEDTNYHRGLIRDGVLLAVDESTAKRAGFKALAPWADALKVAKAKAIAAWSKDHDGEAPPVNDWIINGMPAEKGAVK